MVPALEGSAEEKVEDGVEEASAMNSKLSRRPDRKERIVVKTCSGILAPRSGDPRAAKRPRRTYDEDARSFVRVLSLAYVPHPPFKKLLSDY